MKLSGSMIYAIDRGGELALRHGMVTPLEDELLEAEHTSPRLLRARGLEATDFAVFLNDETEDLATGYLISAVEPDTGEGILVSGDAIEQDPKTWLNPRLCGAIALVGADQMAEFDLVRLHTHVMRILSQQR